MESIPPPTGEPAPDKPGYGSTGPRTAVGKDRSSANPTRHGLTGLALVLQGESIAAYRAHQARLAKALPAGSSSEATIVFEIGDIEWRRQRLLRLEHAHQLRLVEDSVRRTDDHSLHSLASRALVAVNALNAHATAATNLVPFPCSENEFKPFIAGARGTRSIVEEVDGLDARLVRALASALDLLEVAAARGEAEALHMQAVADATSDVQRRLAGLVKRGATALGRMREKAAAELVPGDDRESRRLARYRAELEKSQARLLGILGQAREQRKLAQADARERKGEAVQVRLRVVK